MKYAVELKTAVDFNRYYNQPWRERYISSEIGWICTKRGYCNVSDERITSEKFSADSLQWLRSVVSEMF